MANPEGNGGFKDHPEHINTDGSPEYWSRMATILHRLANLAPNEFIKYECKNMKERMIYKMLQEEDYKEVFDRIDGKAKQTVETDNTHKITQPIKISFKE